MHCSHSLIKYIRTFTLTVYLGEMEFLAHNVAETAVFRLPEQKARLRLRESRPDLQKTES